jgi:hypothetical protein
MNAMLDVFPVAAALALEERIAESRSLPLALGG